MAKKQTPTTTKTPREMDTTDRTATVAPGKRKTVAAPGPVDIVTRLVDQLRKLDPAAQASIAQQLTGAFPAASPGGVIEMSQDLRWVSQDGRKELSIGVLTDTTHSMPPIDIPHISYSVDDNLVLAAQFGVDESGQGVIEFLTGDRPLLQVSAGDLVDALSSIVGRARAAQASPSNALTFRNKDDGRSISIGVDSSEGGTGDPYIWITDAQDNSALSLSIGDNGPFIALYAEKEDLAISLHLTAEGEGEMEMRLPDGQMARLTASTLAQAVRMSGKPTGATSDTVAVLEGQQITNGARRRQAAKERGATRLAASITPTEGSVPFPPTIDQPDLGTPPTSIDPNDVTVYLAQRGTAVVPFGFHRGDGVFVRLARNPVRRDTDRYISFTATQQDGSATWRLSQDRRKGTWTVEAVPGQPLT